MNFENKQTPKRKYSEDTGTRNEKRQKKEFQEEERVIIDILSSDDEAEGSCKNNSQISTLNKKRESDENEADLRAAKKQKVEATKDDKEVVVDPLSSDDEMAERCKKDSNEKSNPLVLIYDRICLYQKDFSCLKRKRWLKDNVVDLALAALKLEHEKTGQTYVFNSLFFSKLRSIRDSNVETKDYYNATKKWFKNNELSHKQFWVIPVCDKFHWYAIVVTSPRSNKPTITVLDSIRKREYESVDLVKTFLKQKYKAEHRGKFRKIIVHIADIPQQTNQNDCGLFTLRSASLLLKKNSAQYATLLMNPQKNTDELQQFYNDSPVPTRKMVSRKIQSLVQNC